MRLHFLALFFLVASSLFCSQPARAQTEPDFAIWSALFFTGQVYTDSPSPTFWLDAHARRSDFDTVVILRPAVGFAFAPWGSLWLGYAWVPVWVDESGNRLDEHRVWEQLTLTYRKESLLLLQSRTRVEQRFLREASGTAHRFREFVRLNIRPRERVPVGIAIWDELFAGIEGATWAKQGFDQNRIFAGLAIYAFDPLFRFEVGYLNVYASRAVNVITHAVSINFFVSFKGRQYSR